MHSNVINETHSTQPCAGPRHNVDDQDHEVEAGQDCHRGDDHDRHNVVHQGF